MFVGTDADSIEDMLEGFVHVNADVVRLEDGAIVRAVPAPAGQVVVIAGGGGGHYPGFAGWVGEGMLDGAVSGQIFSSPSAAQIYRAGRVAEVGGGVVLAYLNYSGDVIHFGEAARQLRAAGIAVEEVVIADDIASRTDRRASDGRGIAGAFFVCKVLGAAAALGHPLQEVARHGRRAAERTVSLGASVSGCTLPGAVDPLFTVEPGRLAVGLGIHGEPGIELQELGSPADVAALLTTSVLDHAPDDGYHGHVAVLVNSLGGCSHEELFMLYAKVREQLQGGGHTLVAPVVGEQLTSLDMIGVSLSAMFLDETLEGLWLAAARTASVRRGALRDQAGARPRVSAGGGTRTEVGVHAASAASQALAGRAVAVLSQAAETIAGQEARLAELDRVGGDGDHGRGMVRGLSAARDAAEAAVARGAGLSTVLAVAGAAWSDKAGGTSGALWGAVLEACASAMNDRDVPTEQDVVAGIEHAVAAVVRLGGAAVGDKTMVDAMDPFARTLATPDRDGTLAQRWQRAVEASERAAQATAGMVATKGRARTHGEKTLGTPDAGAVSFGIVARAVGSALSV